jgi:hypothetical protein
MGLVGFLVFIDMPGKAWIAGAFAVIASVKPQVLYLFFIAFLLWSIFNKKWSALIGLITFVSILNIIILIIDPQIMSQYFQGITNNAPTAWATPTIGTYLRLFFNPTEFLLVFIPPLFGTFWLIIFWIKKKSVWNWKSEMPVILFVSTITSAYIWTYDLVVLLIPLLLAFIWLLGEKNRWITAIFVIIYVAIDLLYLKLHLISDDLKFIWFAPILFLWYLGTKYVYQSSKNTSLVNEVR